MLPQEAPNHPKTLSMGILHEYMSCWTPLGSLRYPQGHQNSTEMANLRCFWHTPDSYEIVRQASPGHHSDFQKRVCFCCFIKPKKEGASFRAISDHITDQIRNHVFDEYDTPACSWLPTCICEVCRKQLSNPEVPQWPQGDIYSCNIPMGSVLRSVGAFQGNIWSVAPFIPGAKLYWDGWKYKNALFSKSPNGPILKFFLVTGEVMVVSELLSDLPVLFLFVGVASGP